MDPRITQARSGDAAALCQLLADRQARLKAYILSQLSVASQQKFDPEDVLQETLISAFRDIGKFEPKSDRAFDNWLTTLADRRIIDIVRYHKARVRGGLANHVIAPEAYEESAVRLWELIRDPAPTPGRLAVRQEVAAAMRIQLARLSDEQRMAIELHYFQNCSNEEIAEKMGTSPGSVRGYLQRGRENLRAWLGDFSLFLSRG